MKIDFSKCPEGMFTHKTNISGNQSLVKLNALIKRLPFGKKFLRTEKIRNSQVYNFARNMIRKYGFKTVMKKEQKNDTTKVQTRTRTNTKTKTI